MKEDISRVHLKNSPFKCKICGMGEYSKLRLDKHLKAHNKLLMGETLFLSLFEKTFCMLKQSNHKKSVENSSINLHIFSLQVHHCTNMANYDKERINYFENFLSQNQVTNCKCMSYEVTFLLFASW